MADTTRRVWKIDKIKCSINFSRMHEEIKKFFIKHIKKLRL